MWLTIAQGFAKHINKNAEALRHKFVTFEGKQEILIEVDHFIKGSPNNNYEKDVFPIFSSEIRKFIGPEIHELITSDYTTTGPIERAASEITLMDAMQAYFEYGMRTCCGIPQVELTGSIEDWEKISAKIDHIEKIDPSLTWWTSALKRNCIKFVETAKGNIDQKYWQSFFTAGGGSGGPFVDGYIVDFFPYTGASETKNKYVGTRVETDGWRGRLTLDEFPKAISKAPVKWNYHGQMFDLEFLSGLVGTTVKESGFVTPVTSWCVLDVTAEKKK